MPAVGAAHQALPATLAIRAVLQLADEELVGLDVERALALDAGDLEQQVEEILAAQELARMIEARGRHDQGNPQQLLERRIAEVTERVRQLALEVVHLAEPLAVIRREHDDRVLEQACRLELREQVAHALVHHLDRLGVGELLEVVVVHVDVVHVEEEVVALAAIQRQRDGAVHGLPGARVTRVLEVAARGRARDRRPIVDLDPVVEAAREAGRLVEELVRGDADRPPARARAAPRRASARSAGCTDPCPASAPGARARTRCARSRTACGRRPSRRSACGR